MRPLRVIAMLALLATLVGCAGPPFQPLASMPADEALVYIYRPEDFLGARVTVYAEDEPIVQTSGGGYFPYLTLPGDVDFVAETFSRSSITLDLEPGQTYYLKLEVGVILGEPTLSLVSPDLGATEIAECGLLESYSARTGLFRRRAPPPP